MSGNQEESTTWRNVYEQCYTSLVHFLPMSDMEFIEHLEVNGLLSATNKQALQAEPTQVNKAVCFLNNEINPNHNSSTKFQSLLVLISSSDSPLKLVASNFLEALQKRVDGPTILKQAGEFLRIKYLYMLPSYVRDLQNLQTFQLAVVRSEEDEQHYINQPFREEYMMNFHEMLNGIKEIFYYHNERFPSRILIEGGPGVGKSTLAYEICKEWSEGNILQEFGLVVLVTLREIWNVPLQQAIRSLLGDDAYQELEACKGSRAMLILDGFDEASEHLESDHFLQDLLDRKVLPQVTLLVTSRAHATVNLSGVERRIEVLGFGRDQVREFVQLHSTDSNPEIVKKFFKDLEKNPHLSGLLQIPIFLKMLISVLDCNQVNPAELSNVVKLLQIVVISIFNRYMQKWPHSNAPKCSENVLQVIKSKLPGISNDALGPAFLLSKIAYLAFFTWNIKDKKSYLERRKAPRLVFTIDDIKSVGVPVPDGFDGYGFFQMTHYHQLPVNTLTYSFSHLSVQEFFSALYISLLPPNQQKELVDEYFDIFPYLFRYYFGLSNSSVPEEVCQLIWSKLTQYPSKHSNDITKCAINCICECEQQLTALSTQLEPLKIDIGSYKSLLPYDCLHISTLLSRYPVKKLMIWWCNIGDDGAEQLAKMIPPGSVNTLEELDLHWNNFTTVGIKHVMKIISANISSLKRIHLGRNEFGDEGMKRIAEAVKSSKAVIKELLIWQCKITAKGAKFIADMLKENKTLEVLVMHGNEVGDKGIAEIASVFGQCSIRELHINHCGISYDGAKALSEGFKFNSTIKEVKLWGNKITQDGAHLMLEAAAAANGDRRIEMNKEFMGEGYNSAAGENTAVLTGYALYKSTTAAAANSNEILDTEPDMENLQKIVAPEIKHEWKMVAYSMDLKFVVAKRIEKESQNDLTVCCQKLFEMWLSTSFHPTSRTWRKLLERIGDVDSLCAAAENIEKALKKN